MALRPAHRLSAVTPSAPTPHSNSSEALRERHGERYRWLLLFTVMIGTMASIMSSTIVNVAIPDMSRYFTLGQERAQWMAAGFMAAMTLSMLTTPWLLQRFGYRSTYAGAIALLLIGGIGGGVSSIYELVMAARVAEGLAAGVLQPIPAIIIMRAFQSHEQGKAMGVFSFGVVLAPAIGPSVGGILVEAFGWRSIFFVVVPFCIAALYMARRFLPNTAPGNVPANQGGVKLDVPGLTLMAVAVLSLLNGLVQLHDADHGVAFVLLAVAAGSFAVFIVQQRRAAAPLMSLALFEHRQFAMGSVVAFIYGMALFGSTYLLPVFMQLALKLPPSLAGAVLLPAGLTLAAVIPISGRLADRYPVSRMVTIGLALLAASFLLMIFIRPTTSLWLITAFAIIGRAGLAFVLPSLNLGSMRGLPSSLISHGSSTINFMRQIGGAIGVSMVGIFLQWRLMVQSTDASVPADSGSLRAFYETFVLIAVLTALPIFAALQMNAPKPVVVKTVDDRAR
ncbi:MAG: transporter [Rhizobacter sp.]|nr:transporter [Rhizobacter sp.]